MKKVTKIEAVRPSVHQQKKLRVAAYCRVSTDSEEQLDSLKTQKLHYETFITGHTDITGRPDWVFAGLYFDEGITGTKKEKRPGLLQMLVDCEAGKIDYVITKSISRFSRNTTDCLEMVRKLLSLNIPIYFEKENLNTASMESELLLSILSSMAEEESVSLSKNVTWAVQKSFENGTFKKSSTPYGYVWDGKKITVDPEKAETVRWIFEQVLAGKGTSAIARGLNEKMVPTKKGGPWSHMTVLEIVLNEAYVGDMLLQKTYTDEQFNRHKNRGQKKQYLHSDHHEAIISREDFEAAGLVIRQHGKAKTIERGNQKHKRRYCFSGKIVCGECGGTFKHRIHYSTKKKYRAWCCGTHISNRGLCSMKYIRDDAIKAAFTTMINKLIFAHRQILKPYVAALRSGSKDPNQQRIKKIETLLFQNAEQRETLTKLMAQGYIDQVFFTEENNVLLKQEEEYRREIRRLKQNTSDDNLVFQAAKELLRFAEKSPMLEAFDEQLFERTVTRVLVEDRQTFVFELKCGLSLKEQLSTHRGGNNMNTVPFGYRIEKGAAVIDQHEASQLRQIYKNYLSGMGLRRAAKEAGTDLHHGKVKRLLTAPHYLGDDFYPPIIDEESFHQVQVEMSTRSGSLKGSNRDSLRMEIKPCTHFSLGKIDKHFDDPKQQAEYVYSLIKCEQS